jgi:hypothetical protein
VAPWGAYGYTMTGPLAELADAREVFGAPTGWPAIELVDQELCAGPLEVFWDDERLCQPLRHGGYVQADRTRRWARFLRPNRTTADLVAHPTSTVAAALFAAWDGRLPFHSGLAIIDGRAWGVLGPPQAGKSTTVAALAVAGVSVVSDDLTVLDGPLAYAGVRTVDLRDRGAIPDEVELARVRDGTRYRLRLREPPALEIPFGGWVAVTDGPETTARLATPGERVQWLVRAWSVGGTGWTTRALEAATHPMIVVERPRRFEGLGEVVEIILRATTRPDSRGV